jgi:hypothetical protein
VEVIRDNEYGGIMMIPLLHQWRIKRCNVRNCKHVPTTILMNAIDGVVALGMCEEHYQEAMAIRDEDPDKTFKIEIDDFDSFSYNKVNETVKVTDDTWQINDKVSVPVIAVVPDSPRLTIVGRVKKLIEHLPVLPYEVQLILLFISGFLIGSILYDILR